MGMRDRKRVRLRACAREEGDERKKESAREWKRVRESERGCVRESEGG